MNPNPFNPRIILFDGVCNLCNGTVRFIIKRDKADLFRFAALQSETGQKIIKQYVNEEEKREEMTSIYYIRDKECLQKSTAVLYILKDLGKGWKLLFPLIYIPTAIRDKLYLLISRNRYKVFGRKEMCMVPNPDIKNKFI